MQPAQSVHNATEAMWKFYREVQRIQERVVTTQAEAIARAATLVADTIEQDGIVYAFGSGHSQSVAFEFYYRAGGLAPCDVIHEKTFGRAERLSGYAALLLDAYPVRSGDLMVVISNSGRNPLPVEMALEAQSRGMKVIGITSLEHSRSVAPRPPLTKRLFEVCDVVIDNCGLPGDVTLSLNGTASPSIGATSTLIGAFIAQSIVCGAALELRHRGVPVPTLCSMNLDQGDACNRQKLSRVAERIRGL